MVYPWAPHSPTELRRIKSTGLFHEPAPLSDRLGEIEQDFGHMLSCFARRPEGRDQCWIESGDLDTARAAAVCGRACFSRQGDF